MANLQPIAMMSKRLRSLVVTNFHQIRHLPRFADSAVMPQAGLEPPSPSKPFAKNAINHKSKSHTNSFRQSLVIRPTSREPSHNQETEVTHKQMLKKTPFSDNDKGRIFDDVGDIVYTKMQNHDPRIMKIMAEVKTKQKRNNLMLLEGKRLIREALLAGCKMEVLIFSRLEEVSYLQPHLPSVGHLYKMPYKEMQIWSDLTTTPGIMGVFQIPQADFFKPHDPLPLTIICDNIREPNNLGAILRTSSGMGCEKLILTKGCASVWESKVLRSACGAHFKTSISSEANWDNIRSLIPPEAKVFLADNNILSTKDDSKPESNTNIQNVPVIPYYSVDFAKLNHVVLVIGGETQGLSEDSYKLAMEFEGARLNVPLSNGVDSLNSATALGVIGFEVKRQFINNKILSSYSDEE